MSWKPADNAKMVKSDVYTIYLSSDTESIRIGQVQVKKKLSLLRTETGHEEIS